MKKSSDNLSENSDSSNIYSYGSQNYSDINFKFNNLENLQNKSIEFQREIEINNINNISDKSNSINKYENNNNYNKSNNFNNYENNNFKNNNFENNNFENNNFENNNYQTNLNEIKEDQSTNIDSLGKVNEKMENINNFNINMNKKYDENVKKFKKFFIQK